MLGGIACPPIDMSEQILAHMSANISLNPSKGIVAYEMNGNLCLNIQSIYTENVNWLKNSYFHKSYNDSC